MSSIYGYLLRETALEKQCFLGLSYWNRTYGKRELISSAKKLTMGVNLEHFSVTVNEQNDVLCNGRVTGVIDAVLFNRDELSRKYNLSLDMSDEEMLFSIITQQGMDHIQEVNGDFAGAIYDEASDQLILFRDHLGIRPLYYYMGDHTFIFSTDIRGILAFEPLNICVDEARIYTEVVGAFRNMEEDTEYAQIHYLRQASYATFNLSDDQPVLMGKRIYWHPNTRKIRLKNDSEYIAELRRLTEDAIKIRMDACDGPIGAEISGGLDSTVIACMIKRLGREGRYFSWSRDPEEKPIVSPRDERILIQEVCERDQIVCQFRRFDNPEANLRFRDHVDRCSPSFVNCSTISAACYWFEGQGVHMVMTGHGGDEGISRRLKSYELWHHKEYIPYIEALYDDTEGKGLRLLRTIKRFYVQTFKDSPRKIRADRSIDNIIELAKPEFLERMKKTVEIPEFTYFYDPKKYIEMGTIRHRMDNTSFQTPRFGIRYMYPYLDYRLIDFALSIPRNLFYRNKKNRWLYWETFKDILPQSIHKLYSKSTLSYESYNTGISDEDIKDANDAMADAISLLDREYWSKYLDFEKLDHYKLKEGCSESDYDLYHVQISRLLFFILSRNAIVNASMPIKKMLEEAE